MDILKLVLTPFVWLLMTFYQIFGDYGWALIFFALLVKIILFPFQLKGKKGMIQMNMLSGQMQKLQKMYGNNKEKYNLEVQKLYEKEKVNPMSGCLWSFLPLLILFPLYAIIREPLNYMMNMTADQMTQIADVVNWGAVAAQNGWVHLTAEQTVAPFVHNYGYNQLYLASLINEGNIAQVQAAVGDGVKVLALNFQFFGINLAEIPNWKIWANPITWNSIGLFILPVISAAVGYFSSVISMKTNAINQQSSQANNATSKTMLLMSPIMSLWIGFTMPAALCVYWVAQYLFSMLQELVASKMLKKDYEKAAEQRARREADEAEEEKREREREREERSRRIEEQKQSKGKKKVLAKKDAEEDKIPGAVKEASRVGLRSYARGRAYDPNRFSADGPTLYHDATAKQVEQSEGVHVLKEETEVREQAALEAAADDLIVEEILEENEDNAAVNEDKEQN